MQSKYFLYWEPSLYSSIYNPLLIPFYHILLENLYFLTSASFWDASEGLFFMFLLLQISDQLSARFSSELSLPKICENFIKAAHDPRISGIYLQIEPLNCGWGKIEEIRRHILDYRKSGVSNLYLS